MTTAAMIDQHIAGIRRALDELREAIATRHQTPQEAPECCGRCLHPRRECKLVGGATERDGGAPERVPPPPYEGSRWPAAGAGAEGDR